MKILKYLLVLALVLAMLFSVGCFAVPEEPDPDPEPEPSVDIVCEGGHYSVKFTEWSPTGCEGDWYSPGTFWVNADGRMFLLGDPVLSVMDVYGTCPTEYVEEIIFNGGE